MPPAVARAGMSDMFVAIVGNLDQAGLEYCQPQMHFVYSVHTSITLAKFF